jgi:hypothetical protein
MALTQEQINQAYQAALGRTADTGGAQFYASSGMDYNTLLNTLQASQEAQSRAVAAPQPSAPAGNNGVYTAPVFNNGTYDFNANGTKGYQNNTIGEVQDRDWYINREFQALLGRNADEAGLNYYLNSGMSMQDIQKSLMASDEYKKAGNVAQTGGVGFNANGVRADLTQQGLVNTLGFDLSNAYGRDMTGQQVNAILKPFS